MGKLMLSVVIPVKNNAKTLPLVLIKASRHLMRDEISHEIIIVDDNSRDVSMDIAERLATIVPYLRVVNEKTNHGLGAVIKVGAEIARGEYILVMPADDSMSVEEFHKMRRYLEDGCDIVWGLRNYEDSFKIIYNLVMRIPYLRNILDGKSNLFCFKNEILKKILVQAKINSNTGVSELLRLAKNYQYKIKYLWITTT